MKYKYNLTQIQQDNLKFQLADILDIHLDPASDTEYDQLEALTRAVHRTVEKHTTVVEVDDDICDMSGGEPDYTGISFENSDQPLTEETKKALAEMNRTAR